MRRFLLVGTLLGGVLLFVLNWFAAAVLPPRYRQFRNAEAVVEAVRSNTTRNDIYAARQGLFVAVSLLPVESGDSPRIGARIIRQLLIEFFVAFGLSLLLLAARARSALFAASFL